MKRRSGLGRGLDALLPSEPSAHPEVGEGLRNVPPDEIDGNPQQPRKHFDEADIAELADSISQVGLLQPLLVRPSGSRYELIAGERRLRAARGAGLERVPVLIVETDDRGSLERALIENIHRSDLDPIEEGAAYRQLIDEGGLTHEQLAERLGRNRVTVTNALRLLDLPAGVQRLLIDGKLTAGHGRALLGLQDSPFQERLATRAAHDQLSVRETEDLVRRYQTMTTPKGGSPRAERPAIATEAQKAIADHLQTRVRVEVGKRKGRIVVDFVSLEELERILGLMLEGAGGATVVSPGS